MKNRELVFKINPKTIRDSTLMQLLQICNNRVCRPLHCQQKRQQKAYQLAIEADSIALFRNARPGHRITLHA